MVKSYLFYEGVIRKINFLEFIFIAQRVQIAVDMLPTAIKCGLTQISWMQITSRGDEQNDSIYDLRLRLFNLYIFLRDLQFKGAVLCWDRFLRRRERAAISTEFKSNKIPLVVNVWPRWVRNR